MCQGDSLPNQELESVSAKTEREQQKQQLMEQVKTLGEQGYSYTSIANLLKINQRTVVKYMQAQRPPMQGKNKYQSILDPYRTIIKNAVKPGVTAKEIYEELVSKGYKGSFSSVSHYIADIRKQKRKGHTTSRYLTRKKLHRWLWHSSLDIKKRSKWLVLDKLCHQYPALQQLYEQVQTFQA